MRVYSVRTFVCEVLANQSRIVHRAHVVAAHCIDSTIVTPHPFLTIRADTRLATPVGLPFIIVPELCNPPAFARLAVDDAIAQLTTEEDLGVVAFDIRGRADGEV